jgi:hypothetical protein
MGHSDNRWGTIAAAEATQTAPLAPHTLPGTNGHRALLRVAWRTFVMF